MVIRKIDKVSWKTKNYGAEWSIDDCDTWNDNLEEVLDAIKDLLYCEDLGSLTISFGDNSNSTDDEYIYRKYYEMKEEEPIG